MSKEILKVHISWKNDRTFTIETDSEMTKEEVAQYVGVLTQVVEREIAEYNRYGNVEDNALFDFMVAGNDGLFPLPPQNQSRVSALGQPFEVSVEWNAHDSDFE